jgi:hypothetical protein
VPVELEPRQTLERIPIPLLPQPPKLLDRAGQNASAAVQHFFESRSWSIGAGGGFYYRGCYFTYIDTEPRWLVAMGLAINAVYATVGGPHLGLRVRARALSDWAHLVSG